MSRLRRPTRFARLPLRLRLTTAFATVMAVLLASAGAILYGQFAHDLDSDIDSSLHAQAVDVAALVEEGADPGVVATSGERLAQIYAGDGRVLGSTRHVGAARLLTTDEARRAAAHKVRVSRRTVGDDDVRVRALPLKKRGLVGVPSSTVTQQAASVAVGESLERRDHELSRLRTLLLIAAPLALLLASLAGYELAGAALRPVDRMRARAEQITDSHLFERLPVPEARDEIGALGRTLNALLERIEAAVARERRLVSDASHELRTPLTTLRAEVDLALRGERDPEELRAALESVAEEAKRMTRLADDLLVLARADQGRLPLHPEPVSVSELLDGAVARASAAAEESERTIVRYSVGAASGARAPGPVGGERGGARSQAPGTAGVERGGVGSGAPTLAGAQHAGAGDGAADGGDGEITVLADRDRVAQALDNLVANALQYGGGEITLSARPSAELVELHVTDEGHGFPGDVLGRAFERFARGDAARGSGSGSGLGLSIVEAVANAHGGTAGVSNRSGGGADAWIALPRGQGASAGSR